MILEELQLADKYDILREIRKGGMGEIHQVRHRLLGQVRVIKVMRRELAREPKLQERFQREARLASQLQHPNIAQLFDYGVAANGTAYMVMEFIDGLTLEQLATIEAPPAVGFVVAVATQGLEALGCMHHAGIVHRDISPDNLMLARSYDGRPLVKLIDLGIAKRTEGEDRLTRKGDFVGKYRYAAPEQFSGEEFGPRGDLYSFGAMLYQILTRTYPIEGNDARELISGHLFKPPVEFDVSDPEGRVPGELREVILQALEKDPQKRLPDTERFIELLTPYHATAELNHEEFERVFEIHREATPDVGPETTLVLEREGERGTVTDEVGRTIGRVTELLDQGKVSEADETLQQGVSEHGELAEFEPVEARLHDALLEHAVQTIHDQIEANELESAEKTLESTAARVGERTALRKLRQELETARREAEHARREGTHPKFVAMTVVAVVLIAAAAWLIPRLFPDPASGSAEPVAGAAVGGATGRLTIDALPWAEIRSITDAEGRTHSPGPAPFTPLTLELPPGRYTVILEPPGATQPHTSVVDVRAGRTDQLLQRFETVDAESFLKNAGF